MCASETDHMVVGRGVQYFIKGGITVVLASASITQPVGGTPPSIVPGAVALEEAYEMWFSCDRQGREDGVSCGSFRCPRCWTVGNEGMSRQIECSNWDAYEDSDSLLSGAVTIKGASFDCLYSDDVLREVLGEEGDTDVQMARDANRSGQHPLEDHVVLRPHTRDTAARSRTPGLRCYMGRRPGVRDEREGTKH